VLTDGSGSITLTQSDPYHRTIFSLTSLSCKYSRKTYTQHQLITILFLRETLSIDYRDKVDPVELPDPIKDPLQLELVPHYSTLRKFMTRVPPSLFMKMLKNLGTHLFGGRDSPHNCHRCLGILQRLC
jgi:hypothetical protein